MLETALFPRKLASNFLNPFFTFYVGSESKSGSAKAKIYVKQNESPPRGSLMRNNMPFLYFFTKILVKAKLYDFLLPTSMVSSVPDPWHFGVDPDPRIHASE